MALSIPMIHMNGTSAGELKREIREAYDAIKVARDKLANMTVHGRDHYPKADKDSFGKAQHEHIDRLSSLDAISADLLEIHKGIVEQTRGQTETL